MVVIPLLFMGSLLTESFFGIPGLGSYTIDAIQAQDFAVVRAMVFIGSVLRGNIEFPSRFNPIGVLDQITVRLRDLWLV